jgi:hypothetical protein
MEYVEFWLNVAYDMKIKHFIWPNNESLKKLPWWDQNYKVQIGSKYCIGMKATGSDLKRLFTVNCFDRDMYALCEKLS